MIDVKPKLITSSIVTAQSFCPRKAFLLLYPHASQSTDTPHRYVQILEERAYVNQARHVAAVKQRASTPCSHRVRFASVDRNAEADLGLDLISTDAAVTSQPVNTFLVRPDINLPATLRALEGRDALETLAEPNIMAING